MQYQLKSTILGRTLPFPGMRCTLFRLFIFAGSYLVWALIQYALGLVRIDLPVGGA